MKQVKFAIQVFVMMVAFPIVFIAGITHTAKGPEIKVNTQPTPGVIDNGKTADDGYSSSSMDHPGLLTLNLIKY